MFQRRHFDVGHPREGTPALSLLRDSGHNGVKLLPPIG